MEHRAKVGGGGVGVWVTAAREGGGVADSWGEGNAAATLVGTAAAMWEGGGGTVAAR